MTKLTAANRTDASVSEFFDKGFLDNTEEMAKLAKVTGRSSGIDSRNMGKRLHLGEAQDTKQNQDYTTPSNSFSVQGILHKEKVEPSEFQSNFSGPEFLESKEHREAMKDVYESQVEDQEPATGAASRDWIQHKIRSLDLDECGSASSVKTFPTRTSHIRGTGLSRRRKSIPHHLEPLHLQESRKFAARRRGSLPLSMTNSTFQGPALNSTNKFSSLPRITESALVERESSSSPWTEMSENDTVIENGENSISGVYKNIFGKKLKQPTTITTRRRSTSFDFSMRKEAEIEKRRPKQKWRILVHKRKCLFKDEIDLEPKLNRGKLPSSRLPRL